MAADGTVTIKIKADGKQAEKSVQGIKGVFEGLGNHVKNTTSRVTDMVKAFGLVKLAQAGFSLLRNSMDGAIKRLDTLRTSDKVFENMGFSADETSTMMDNLNASIKGLPTPLNEAVNGVQLMASATGDLGRSEKIYSALNNAVLGFGGTSEMANNAVLQLSQGLADGRIRGQEWNSMLNSNMGPSLRAIADMMGLTMGELKSGLSDGSIEVDKFMDTLITLNEEGGGGLASLQQIAQDATGGIQTSMANMRTAVSRGLANMIESIDEALVAANFPSIGEMISMVGETIEGALNKASGAIAPLIGWLATLFNTVKNSTAFQTFKQVVVDVFETGKQMISDFAQSEAWETIKSAIKQVADVILSIDFGEVVAQIGEFIDTWSPLIAGIMGAVAAFKVISGVIATVTAVKTALLAVTSAFGMALVTINWPLVAIAAAIGAVIAVGVLLWKNWETVSGKASQLWQVVVEAWNNLVTGTIERFNDIKETVTNAWNNVATGTMERLNDIKEKVMSAWQNVVTGTIERFENIKEVIVTAWNNVVTGTKERLTEMWETIQTIFQSISDFFTTIWEGIKTIFSVAWEVIKNIVFVAIGIVATVIQGYFNTILNITTAIWNLIGDYILGAWEWIKNTTILAVTAVWEMITNAWTAVSETTSTIWNAVTEVILNVWNTIKETALTIWTAIVNVITVVWEGIKSAITTAAESVRTTVSTIWEAIKSISLTIWTAISSMITTVWNSIKNVITTITNIVKSVITNVWNSVKSTTNSVWNSIKSVISSVWNTIKSVITTAINAVKNTVTNIWNSIRSTTSSVWNGIRSTISNLLNSIKSTFSNIFNSLRSVVSNAFNNVKTAVLSGMNTAWSTVTGFFSKFRNAGKNIVQNIADGISGAIGKVTGAIKGVTQKIRDFLPFSPPKDRSSPLADIHKNGIGTQIAKGIDGGQSEVNLAMRHLLDVPDINRFIPNFLTGVGNQTTTKTVNNRYDQGKSIQVDVHVDGSHIQNERDLVRETKLALQREGYRIS